MTESLVDGIAIIGLHGRFPGAGSAEEFWSNLVAGRETISFFSDAELTASGLDPAALRRAGHYVPARGVLKEAECFDAAFFGIHPKEAEVMDPQHRVFLEACWEALERAGYAPGRIQGAVGVYAGATFNTYYLHALHPRPELRELVGQEQVMLGNEKDYLATRVAYKLNLKGPAISLNTACSSSLVAVCQACQSLLTYQCDLALAGGISVRTPQQEGYFHQEGNIASPDGHTRTFDATAKGTVFSNGVTIVVLKRLSEALGDGDKIYAVIKGSALNNDGSQRVSFGAPGVEGQSEVITLAQEIAGIEPESVSYIEAHGTATPLGDPIEVTALTKAFRRGTKRNQFCALGSVKSNVGHLDAAAGTAGLIKTALALEHHLLPPSLHFENPNPKLDLENSPFFVNSSLREWKSGNGSPLVAGVSSFGTGGTNAHIVVEEAPQVEPSGPSRPWQLLLLSAKTAEALESATRNLAEHLKAQPEANLADVAYTLQVGRSEFIHRRAVLCRTASEAIALLEKPDTRKVFTGRQELKEPPVVFMFPGQGAQYVNMGSDVYRQERAFRETVDQCAQILQPILETDLRDILFAPGDDEEAANERLRQTRFTQPALFTVEYALAQMWMAWGVKPAAMTGHSVGEYVAGCLAGVFSLEEALVLVARRAEFVQAQAPGSMLAVRLSEPEIRPLLNCELSIAAINSPNLCVVSGPHEAVARLEKEMTERGVGCKALHTSHAFHSAMMEPVVGPFTDLLRKTRLMAPKIPYVSNVTGQWITDEQATSPEYWAGHVRQTVRFSESAGELLKDPQSILLEVGPGQTLLQLVRQHPERKAEQAVVSTLGASRDQELPNLLASIGRLWLAGAALDWRDFYEDERRQRVVLPTYPFERKRCWPSSPVTASVPTHIAPVEFAAPVEPEEKSAAPQAEETATPMAIASPAPPRKEHLVGLIRSLVEELSGTNLDGMEAGASFLEIGLDSLLLTQAATLFQRRFGVAISFRQLMEDLSTIDSLAQHLDERLPAEAFVPVTGAQAPAAPAQAPVLAAGPPPRALEKMLQQQLEMTAQLLAAVRDQSRTVPAPPAQMPPDASAASRPTSAEFRGHGPFRPMDRGSSSGLTEQQQRMIDSLIASYTKRTIGSKRLAEKNRPFLADPRSVAGFKQLWKEIVYPIYTVRSGGSKVWDVDGNEYVDFVMGFGASLFGHRPPFVVEAIQRQLELGFEIGPIQPQVGEAAALIRELTGMERVAFCNTGSEAVLAAIRLARTVTGRDKIAMFANSYHGIFDEVLARPLTVNGEMRAAPIAPGIPDSGTSQVMMLDYGDPESLEIIRRHGPELAAVLVEPVQSRRLDLQPREFLHELRRITEQTSTALVFDEVITGFRVHPGGAQVHFGVRADMATYGKIVGGGMPIGVVTGKARFLDALDGGQWQFGDASFPEVGVTFFAGTFVRHPITIAVAKAVLEHLKREGPQLQKRVAALAADGAQRMRSLISRFQAPLHLAQFSSIMSLTVQPEFKHGGLLFCLLRERGIHIFENRTFVFTSAHTEGDVELLVNALEQSLNELATAGFLPKPSGPGAPIATAREPARRHHATSATAVLEFDLTEAQREMWLATMMGEEAARSYNVTLLLRLEGPLHREALENALQSLVDRHDSLRAAFDLKDPVQRIRQSLKLGLAYSDLSRMPLPQRHQELDRIARNQGEKSFDLSVPPLLRTQLVKLDERDHVLILTYSHLIVDGWSGGVLLHELKMIYGSYVEGRSHDLKPALQLADYSEVLRSEQYRAAAARAETYWRQQFATLPPELDLPSDRLRPAQRGFHAARVSIRWEPEFYQQLKKASARHGATLLNFMLAGFNVLLHRLNGQEDLVVGMPLAGQISTSVESIEGGRALVGHCVNVLPVRSQCRDEVPFAEYLKSLKATMLDAYEHQELTFGRLLQLLNISRDAGRVPLVPVIFNLDRAVSGFELPGLNVQIQELSRSSLVFDISINVIDNDRELRVDCDFNTDLFDSTTMERWLGHFRTLLAAAIAEPNQKLGELPLLSEAERHQILTDWNDNALSITPRVGLHTFFEEQAELQPDAVAVAGMGKRLTYGELDERANRLAQLLRRHGSGPDVPVGLYLTRSTDLVVAMLAILKSGGSYVALDPVYPPERLSYILAEAKSPLVITERSLSSNLGPNLPATLIVLDEVNLELESGERCAPGVGPDNLAYCLFTSGSTGRPKGVALEHRSAIAFVEWARTVYTEAELAGVLFSTSVCFDLSVFEVFIPLSFGGKVIVAENALHLPSLPEANEVTLINSVPSAISELLKVGGIPRSVAVINLAGEPLAQTTVDELYRLPQVKKVYDLYGPTEATTYSTYTLRTERSVATIGRPIANTQAYVLDRHLQPVPIGVAGELYLGGAGLARGYLHRPDLTEERFIANPFSGRNGHLYRTGDLVRYLPDGRLQYLGRLDHQVKIRGFRIELGEIEACLTRVEGVAGAVVVAREESRGDKRLIAYIVPKLWKAQESESKESDKVSSANGSKEYSSSSAPSAAELRVALRSQLPEYMIPSAFVFLETLPLTPNGKVDRKALPSPDHTPDMGQSYEAPRGAIEEKLAGIMSSILSVPRVGRQDSFFDLGGHSILAVTLFNKIEQEYGRRLPLTTLFRAPTIAGLATTLDSGRDRSKEWTSLVPIHTQGSKIRFFCVHGAGGNILLYRDLARHLGTEHPFYGLQSQGLDGKTSPLTTVEAMAERYLREIRDLQPEGPYCLGGYCLGGTIAYHMAQRLRQDGQEVALVALLDTYNLTRMEQPRVLNYLWQKIEFHCGNLVRLPLRNWPGYLSHKLRVARDGEFFSLWRAIKGVFTGNEMENASRSVETSVQQINDRAAEAYRPEPYAGRVSVFKPRVNYDFYPDPQMGWGDLVIGQLNIVELPVNPHAMLVEPYVQILADRLREDLDEAVRSEVAA
jgi:amino acid adenylation domain-containing protein